MAFTYIYSLGSPIRSQYLARLANQKVVLQMAKYWLLIGHPRYKECAILGQCRSLSSTLRGRTSRCYKTTSNSKSNSTSKFQFQIPNSNSKFKFQIQIPNSNSKFKFQIPNSNSEFQFQIPISNSKFQITITIPKSKFQFQNPIPNIPYPFSLIPYPSHGYP
jgi:hypothetical protein